MDIATIMLLHAAPPSQLTPEERAQFHAEQQCSIPFCGLPPVARLFLDELASPPEVEAAISRVTHEGMKVHVTTLGD